MKKYLVILFSLLLASFSSFAQVDSTGDDNSDGAVKLRERMKEYIQKKLNLSKGESEKFSPVFMRYLLELRRANRENKGDGPMRQLKVAEVRVKFRTEFRQILDEKRANRVFEIERQFVEVIKGEVEKGGQKSRFRPRSRAMIIERRS